MGGEGAGNKMQETCIGIKENIFCVGVQSM